MQDQEISLGNASILRGVSNTNIFGFADGLIFKKLNDVTKLLRTLKKVKHKMNHTKGNRGYEKRESTFD